MDDNASAPVTKLRATIDVSPRMTKKLRRDLQDALRTTGSGPWIKVSSESDVARNQVYFWFQVTSAADLDSSVRAVMETLQKSAVDFPKTEFNASFIELTQTEKTDWESLDDTEIRQGWIARKAGSDSVTRRRPEFTVFDRDL